VSNLKLRVQQIQQQLAVSNAETIARFKEVKAELQEGLTAVRQSLSSLESKVDQGFSKLETAMVQQELSSQDALNQLLDLAR